MLRHGRSSGCVMADGDRFRRIRKVSERDDTIALAKRAADAIALSRRLCEQTQEIREMTEVRARQPGYR